MRRCKFCGRRIWSWRIGWLVLSDRTIYFHPACWEEARGPLAHTDVQVDADGSVRFRPRGD